MQLVCLICNKKLNYENSDIAPLVQHLNQAHPRINISRVHKSQQTPQKATGDLITFVKNSASFQKSVEKSVQTELQLDWSKYFTDSLNIRDKMENQENRAKTQERRKNSTEGQEDAWRKNSRKSEESQPSVKNLSKDSDEESLNISNKTSTKNSNESVLSQPKLIPKPKMPSPKPSISSRPLNLPETSKKTVELPKTLPMKKTSYKKLNNYNTLPQTTSNRETSKNKAGGDSLSNRKKKLYVISVGKWRPGGSSIVCPNCGVNKRPTIRCHNDRVSHSNCGANLILACWPFCFTPCLFPAPSVEYLHCAVCNHYLGKFDHNKQLISPNPDLLKDYSVN